MNRRSVLRTGAGVVGAAALAGCAGLFETQPRGTPAVLDDRPDGIYVPTHTEGMRMSGTAMQGDYAFGLLYSYPHRFWNVNGESISLTEIDAEDDVHLMASVWEPETMTILPETGLSVEIYRDGSLVSQETIYPMLSQPMGFHYGANFGLDGDGEYTVVLSAGAPSIRRTGAFRDRFSEPASVEIPFEYTVADRDEIAYERLDDRAGTRGAIDPMEMDSLPNTRAPAASDLPGTVVGEATADGTTFVATVLDTPPAGVNGDGQYLAVSARTQYNRLTIPAMGLEAVLSRGGETVYRGGLTRTLDPELRYHYGAVVDRVDSGDDLSIRTTVQSQTARHEGYETAFGGLDGEPPAVEITVG